MSNDASANERRRRPPLSVLTESLREAKDDLAVEALIESLAGDDRAGARALVRRARRRLEAGRAER
ncbi:MAG: hypothetical protein JRF61_18415, partial [Deltaproteobacteria bacterium]|nr:hypothetical protein [Deltaproteobacteria bacterium]